MLAHIALRHIHKLTRQIAYRATLVSHLVHTHRRRYRHVALMLRYVVEVAVENARYIRCIRHYGEHLLQVETCQSDGHVLQCFGAVVGIYAYSHAVVGTQGHIGREPLIVGKEHVVVLVDLELLISQHGIDASQRHTHAIMLHLCTQSEGDAKTFAGVEYTCSEIQRLLVKGSSEARVEDKLLVVAVVAHLSFKVGLHRIRLECKPDGVELYARCHERVKAQLAIDALRGRRRHIYICVVEVVTEVAQGTCEDVFASGIEVKGYIGQTFAQSQLVDISLLRLPHCLFIDILQLLQYVLYRTAAVQTQRKVAASDCRVG